MERAKSHLNMDSAFVLLLFALFAGSILMVLLFGASAYEKMVSRDSRAFDERTAIQYVVAKVRANEVEDSILVGSFQDQNDSDVDDISTLYLRFEGAEEEYYTKIYYYNGYLMEVLCQQETGLKPEDGNIIMKVNGASFCLEGNILYITIVNKDDSVSHMALDIRTMGGGSNDSK